MDREHTDRAFHAELGQLRENLLHMGAKVEEMLSKTLNGLWSGDEKLIEQALLYEPQIDQLEVDLDGDSIRLLARWQPVASDLRLITTVFKVVTQLERIGDLCEQLCRHRLNLARNIPPDIKVVLRRMADYVTDMLRDALDAFATNDAQRAENVVTRDRIVDAYYAQSFPQFMRLMLDRPENIDAAIQMQSMAKVLERIGDQSTNVAEMVVFLVRGRHFKSATGAGERPDSRSRILLKPSP